MQAQHLKRPSKCPLCGQWLSRGSIVIHVEGKTLCAKCAGYRVNIELFPHDDLGYKLTFERIEPIPQKTIREQIEQMELIEALG